MPLCPWQPTSFSTPTSASSCPSSSSLHSNVSRCLRNEDGKENRPTSIRGKSVDSSKKPKKTHKTPNMLSRRNERERNRVHLLNLGFDRLRAVVPKREGEHLSKISTLKKAIWYIEHLDRVLHEEVTPEAADSGVVGTDLGDGHLTVAPLRSQAQQQQQESPIEEKRLSPIFPARMDEPSPGLSLMSLHYVSRTSDSGYGNTFYSPEPQEPPPPPVRMWTIDFDGTSTPDR